MEDQIVVKPDTTELEGVTSDAERSAQLANESAIAATAAAVNQAQIINDVTQYAREDADKARQASESAADESKRAAEVTAVVAETAINEIRVMMEDYHRRLTALESRESEPVQVIGENNVSPINPQETEQGDREDSMESETPTEKTSSRKGHGRRRRR